MTDSNSEITLNPEVAMLLQMQAAAGAPPMEQFEPAALRQAFSAQSKMTAAPPVEMASVEDRLIPGDGSDIPVRIYRPVTGNEDLLPVLVFYHGGGWVICDLDTHDDACRSLDRFLSRVSVWRIPLAHFLHSCPRFRGQHAGQRYVAAAPRSKLELVVRGLSPGSAAPRQEVTGPVV